MDGAGRLPERRRGVISVVVCTFNPREDYLRRCIEAVQAQTLPASSYELFVVDNNSSPPVESLDVVRKAGVRVVREERQGLTAARERAARTAAHDLLVFVDDDNILAPDYLAVAEEIMVDRSVGVLGAAVEPVYDEPPPDWVHSFEGWLAVRRLPSRRLYLTSIPKYSEYFPIGAGMCIRRGLLLEYFDTKTLGARIEGRHAETLSSGEDIDIDLFSISRGKLVGSCGRLRLEHLIPQARTRLEYLTRLARGNLQSSFTINRKWRTRFGADVFDVCAQSRPRVAARGLVYGLLSISRSFRLRFLTQVYMLRLLSRER